MDKKKFKISETVFLKTDINALPRTVTRYTVFKGGRTYELTQGTDASWHFSFEISNEPLKQPNVTGFNKASHY